MRARTGVVVRGRAKLALVVGLTLAGCADDGGGADAGAGAGDAGPGDAAAAGEAGAEVRAEAGGEAGGEVAAASCPARPEEAECDPVASEVVPLGAGRVRHCAFDVGSTNVRLVMSSMVAGDASSIEGDRVCKKVMRLRDKTQDPATMMGRPLLETDMDALVAQLKTYRDRCTQEQGTMVGAVATQWARNATNQDEIRAWFKSKLGLDLNILTGDQEGGYAYAAGTHGKRDRLILDVGGGSFQLTHWATGEARPTAASVPLGHDASSTRVWARPEYTSFAAARQAYLTELAVLIAAKPETAAAFAQLKTLIQTGRLDKELLSLGDSGVILALEGKLQDPAGRWVDEPTYLQRLDERRRALAASPAVGPKKTMTIAAVNAFLDTLASNDTWYADLRSECIRKAYGAKVLGFLTLVSWLARDHGLGERVVFTSGEMAEGFVLEKLGM